MRRLLLLFFAYVLLIACGGDKPGGIIPQQTMPALLTDLHLANGYSSQLFSDTISGKAASAYAALYKKYGTDSATVRKSITYYSQRPDEMELFYKDVSKRLNELLKQEQARAEREQKLKLQKIKAAQEIERLKAKFEADRLSMIKGTYDFGLADYRSPAEPYLKVWKKSKTSSKTSPADTLRKKGLSGTTY